MRLTVPVVLTMLLLSGCTSQDSNEPADTIAGGPSTSLAGPETEWRALTFASSEPINATQWFNGSFAPTDACNPIGCVTGAAVRPIDISEHLPLDVPVRLRAILNYTTNQPAFAQPILIDLLAPAPTIYARTDDSATQGHVQIDATMVRRDEPIIVELVYTVPAGADMQTPYEFRLDIWGQHEFVPGGVPVVVSIEPGTTIRATTTSGQPTEALVYAPDDSFLHRARPDNENVLWNDTTVAGDHVFVFPESDSWVRLNATNVTRPLRVLDLQHEYSASQPVAGQPISWSFAVDRQPLHVGIFETNVTMLVAAREDSQATLASPDGTIAQGPIGCGGICVQGGAHFATLRSMTGDERNTPGEYDARYEPTQEAGVQVGHFVTYYTR